MVNVESFSVDNLFRDQVIIYVEGFSVDTFFLCHVTTPDDPKLANILP